MHFIHKLIPSPMHLTSTVVNRSVAPNKRWPSLCLDKKGNFALASQPLGTAYETHSTTDRRAISASPIFPSSNPLTPTALLIIGSANGECFTDTMFRYVPEPLNLE